MKSIKLLTTGEAELGAADDEGNVGEGGGLTTTHSNKTIFKWSKIITFNTNILIYCEK